MADKSKKKPKGKQEPSIEEEMSSLADELGSEVGSLWKGASTPRPDVELEKAEKRAAAEAQAKAEAEAKAAKARGEVDAAKARAEADAAKEREEAQAAKPKNKKISFRKSEKLEEARKKGAEAALAAAAALAGHKKGVKAPPADDSLDVREELRKRAEETGRAEDVRQEHRKPPEKAAAPGDAPAAPEKPAEDPAIARRRPSWIYEMPIFYLLLVGLQRTLFPEDPLFLSVNPNPMWLGILLFGLRYGLLAGFFTGLASAALYSWGIDLIGNGYRFEDADFYVRPGMFVLIGVSLGTVADNGWDRVKNFRLRIAELLERISGLQQQVQTEQKVLRAVEQQVVSQMSSIVTLFHGSKELGTLDRLELLPAIHKFFTQALRATKTSLYLPHEGQWILFQEIGWTDKDVYPKVEDAGRGIVGRAGSERRTVSVRDILSDGGVDGARRDAGSDALMAAPIQDPSGKTIAVFAVQAMEFMRFNSSSVNLMSLLAEWGADSVAKCYAVEELKSRSLFDEDYEVHSARYFEGEAQQQFDRSKRYALPFSIILVSAPGAAKLPDNKRVAFLRMLSRIVREASRSVDVVCRSPLGIAEFVILMSTTTKESAETARARLAGQLQGMDLPVPVRFGVGSYNAEMKEMEELIAEAGSNLL